MPGAGAIVAVVEGGPERTVAEGVADGEVGLLPDPGDFFGIERCRVCSFPNRNLEFTNTSCCCVRSIIQYSPESCFSMFFPRIAVVLTQGDRISFFGEGRTT